MIVGEDDTRADDRGQPVGDTEIKLDEAAQAAIGRQLRAVYSEIVQQPVPDQLLQLLEELE